MERKAPAGGNAMADTVPRRKVPDEALRSRRYSVMLYLPALICALAPGALAAESPPTTTAEKPSYVVKRARVKPALVGRWEHPTWRGANELRIDHFLPHSTEKLPASDHRPDARARVLYDADGLYLHFRVKDKYVRSVATEYRGRVWEDAAVEFFVQPKPERGYFNFEINCGGTMLLSYHENPDWSGAALRKPGAVPWELASQVSIYHSMPEVVEPEIPGPVSWQIEYFVPFSLLEAYVGPLGTVGGQKWRANFYKIAETNSHPHFASWSPILEGVSFHQPLFFGVLRFED
jgi:hypothetical protein